MSGNTGSGRRAGDASLHACAAAFGALVWLAIALISGRAEAWDSGLYGAVGLPALLVAAAAFGWLGPARAWRWGASMTGGHAAMAFATGLAGGSSFNLFPLTVILFAIFSLPFVVVSGLAGLARRRLGRRA